MQSVEIKVLPDASPVRTVRLYVPPGPFELVHRYHVIPYKPSLVVVLHGGFGTGDGMAGLTRVSALASGRGLIFPQMSERFVVLYPDGIDYRWNDGRRFDGERPGWQDDVAFIRTAIDKVCGEYDIDRSCIYVCGISNGAMMTLRLVKECPELFAAAGIIAGTLPAGIEHSPTGSPVPLMFFYGTDDTYVPIGGGPIKGNRGEVLSLKRTISHFCAAWAIPDAPDFERVANGTPDDGLDTERLTWGAGTSSEIILYLTHGAGHTWPGCPHHYDRLLGPTTHDVDATAELWSFFSRHRKKTAAEPR
jgi:polyhydroxybutyrate depolymerase